MGVEPGEPSEQILMKVQRVCQKIHLISSQCQQRAEFILRAQKSRGVLTALEP